MIRYRALVLAGVAAVTVLGTSAPPAAAQDERRAAPDTGFPTGYVKEFGTMWTFDAPPLDYWQARYGFQPDSAWLERARLASVRLPGCSASFVSDQGLVMTNHHCARSCISAVSPADTNYQRSGFVARTPGEEKACPGLYVDQLVSIEDVTPAMRARITATDPAQAVQQRQAAMDSITAACQSGGLTCQVVMFYQGGMYSLYKYRRYGDVRLVMAPEEEISFFGGDPDNFTYPRYDLDLTLLRVYEEGAPHRPEHFFRWSADGARDGDLVFVIGNPGSTGRLLTMAQMEYLRDVQYPAQLDLIARQLSLFKELAGESEAARRQYENTIFGLENAQKAIRGYRRGLLDSTIMARKRAFERDFRARIRRDPQLESRYGRAWDAIAGAQKELAGLSLATRYYGFGGGSQLLNLAGALVRLPAQAALPDSQRLPQYRGEGLAQIRQAVQRDLELNPEQEKLFLAAQLTAARRELPQDDPFLRAVLQGRSPEVAAEALVEGTRLGQSAVRRQLLEGGASAVARSDDPLIRVARAIDSLGRGPAMRAAAQEAIVSANAELIGRAIFDAYGKKLPPDATFTLRISDGVVRGYPMNGTIAPPYTTIYGLFGRSASFGDEPPFHIPERWREREDSLNLATPLNFVSTNDIIGGNSGSPVINRDAEVVGLIFDGNIEMLPNRFIFTDEVSRSVSVHSEGIIEALRRVYGASRIADELEAVGAPAR